MDGRSFGWLVALALVAGCATAKPPPAVVTKPAPKAAPPPLRLAWMPLEARVSPEVANAVNARLAHVAVAGMTESFQAPVSMEMAQLAMECIERTPKCYSAVGRSVRADRLVWAELVRPNRRDASMTVRLSLFDVAGGALARQGARTFPNPNAARDGAAAFVDETFGATVAAAGGPR